jgi:pimeloyl-ACP methyl ester carboxylesterase
MQKRLLSYKSSQVGYCRFGAGAQPVICFHGYGEEATGYAFLEKYAGTRYTFYAIDLPFHGQTNWKEGLNFTHTDLQQIIHDMLLENDFHPDNYRDSNLKLAILGFSLGGRVALSLYQAWPETFERLVLLAPDGLKVNFWYWLATRTWAGKKLFSFTMKYPQWFIGFLRLMNKSGLVNASVFKFVGYYINNKPARLQLYHRWITLRRLKPNLKRIKSSIRQQHTIVRLIYGEHDRIILPVRGEQFRHGIEEHCTLRIIASGHQVLHEKHAEEIMSSFQ